MTNPNSQSERAAGRMAVAILMKPCVAAAGKAPVSYGEELPESPSAQPLPAQPQEPPGAPQGGSRDGCGAGLAMEQGCFCVTQVLGIHLHNFLRSPTHRLKNIMNALHVNHGRDSAAGMC